MMTATKVRRLMPYKDFTHSLLITLGGSSYLSQLQTSLQRFQKQASTKIPERAFWPPDHCHLYLGRLDLRTAQRAAAFSKVLHSLDYRKLLELALEHSAPSSSVVTNQNDTARSVPHVTPLRVDISGLTTKSPNPSHACDLHMLPIDPTDRLHRFRSSLENSFSAAGFPIIKLEKPTVAQSQS